MKKPRVAVIIPVLNEEGSLPKVLERIPRKWVNHVVVVDNGSTDRSAQLARQKGAEVIGEAQKGYGAACLKGMDRLRQNPPEIVVFLDGDFSSDPNLIPKLIEPIRNNQADFVLGQRVAALQEAGAMPLQARFGNALATFLITFLWEFEYSDLGPFRAIRWEALEGLGMSDRTWGWTIEMQIKAIDKKLRIVQLPIPYSRRLAGKSKISGTVSGTLKAGFKIIQTIFRLRFSSP